MSQHRFINPPELLPGQGFSHVAVPAPGQIVFLAGQTAHAADGTVAGASMAEQADAALANLATALKAAGAQPEHLVALQIFVTDVQAYRDALDEIGTAWRRHLGKHYPTVSLFGIAELFDPDAMIEIVSTAVVDTAVVRQPVDAARRNEVEQVLESTAAWAQQQDDVVAVALVGSWARGEATMSSDLDLVVLTDEPQRYGEDTSWIPQAAGATARLVGTDQWGILTERRVALRSGLELDYGFVEPTWAAVDPPDPGTAAVAAAGLVAVHDPGGVLEPFATGNR